MVMIQSVQNRDNRPLQQEQNETHQSQKNGKNEYQEPELVRDAQLDIRFIVIHMPMIKIPRT